jgi:hypothetical protein
MESEGTIFYFEPSFSGISGNMLLGALVDIGGSAQRLQEVIEAIGRWTGETVRLETKRVVKRGVSSLWVEPVVEGERRFRFSGLESLPPLLQEIPLEERGRRFVLQVYRTLIEGEGEVHGVVPEEVHLEELGSLDTLIDIAGVASLAEELGLLDDDVKAYSTPVRVGRGEVETRSGTMPNPPFVTTQILKTYGIPFAVGGEKAELTTPTGISLLVHLVDRFEPPPPMRVLSEGRGAGTLDLPGRPNLLRVLRGAPARSSDDLPSVLETTVDDVTGEVLGYTLERLYREGALDVQILSTLTKKNRPGHLIQVLSPSGKEEGLCGVLMEETGTLGVRVRSSERRTCLEREIRTLDFEFRGFRGPVRVKVAKDREGKISHLKAEYEDARRVAEETKAPLKLVLQAIEERARAHFRGAGL